MTHTEPEPAVPAENSDQRRQQYAHAMAEAAGSKCFRKTGREWDHMRSAWLAHADAVLPLIDAEAAQLRAERDQYAAAIRELILTVKHTAYDWSHTQPDYLPKQDVVRALNQFAGMPRPMPEGLRNDLWQRIAGAYYLRFESDGHPEDSTAAADEAMAVVQPELDALRTALDRVRALADRLDEFAENAARVDDRALYRAIANDLRNAANTDRSHP